MKSMKLDSLSLDGDTQPRMEVNSYVVDEYAEAMKAGAVFPPLEVFTDGAKYWIVDGIHRWHAARKAGLDKIKCNIHQGTLEEARWFSYGVNQAHGLRRTNDDKRKAVMAALRHPKGAKLSNVQIAEHCGVSEYLVRDCRKELESIFDIIEDKTRTVTRGGKTYEQNTANIGKASATPAEVEENEEEEAEDESFTTYEIPPVPESTVWVGIEEEVGMMMVCKPDEKRLYATKPNRRRIADVLDVIAEEIRDNPAVVAARLENMAIKLKQDV